MFVEVCDVSEVPMDTRYYMTFTVSEYLMFVR